MATMYELDESNSLQNRRAKLIRLIEFSDHLIRLNRRENIQLESRLRILQQQQMIIKRNYEREIYSKRFQLGQLYQALNDSSERSETMTSEQRVQTPISFYALKMRRNQSAPPPLTTKTTSTTRPTTTPANLRTNKRAMSVFKQITLKPAVPTMDNLLLFVENPKKNLPKVAGPTRSRTMLKF